MDLIISLMYVYSARDAQLAANKKPLISNFFKN